MRILAGLALAVLLLVNAALAAPLLHKGGIATSFQQKGIAGACGAVSEDTDFVAALDSARYSKGKWCGRQVRIMNQANKKQVTVTVADECPTCKNANSIDLSLAAFNELGEYETGELPIIWEFL